MLFQILKVLVGFYYKVFLGLKVTGRENIPENEAFVLCANHLSLQDPILLTLVMGKRVRYMAKEELFKNKFLASIIRFFGAFPVQRGSGDMGIVTASSAIIDGGEILMIFPQGTRDKKRKGLKGHTGAARIACMSGVKMLPVGITDKYRLFGGLRVNIGKPVDCAIYRGKEMTQPEYADITREVMGQIYELSDIHPKKRIGEGV